MQNIIIDPQNSSWIGTWKFFTHILLFIGYYNDPIYVAFTIGYKTQAPEVVKVDANYREDSNLLFELIVDIFMTVDIVLCFLTAFYREMKPVKNIWEITKNYASGYMIFDLAATVTGFFAANNTDLYWFKLIRFIHARTVYSSISNGIKASLARFGFNKASAEKASFIIDLILYLL